MFFPKDDLRLLLPEMMKRYDDHQESSPISNHDNRAAAPSTTRAIQNAIPMVIETPCISQMAAFAQVHTAGSSVSCISSLGRSETTAGSSSAMLSRRSTRSSSRSEERDSDDNVTDNESE
jgi:hypothetical protein